VVSHRLVKKKNKRLNPTDVPEEDTFIDPVHLLHPRWFLADRSRPSMDVGKSGGGLRHCQSQSDFFPARRLTNSSTKSSRTAGPDSRLGCTPVRPRLRSYDDLGPTDIFFTGGKRSRDAGYTPSSSGTPGPEDWVEEFHVNNLHSITRQLGRLLHHAVPGERKGPYDGDRPPAPVSC